jgi:hypothetical protein
MNGPVDITLVLTIISLLITKHFVVDFLFQSPYQYLNKGTYGHPGGLLHAGLHALATAMIFLPIPGITVWLALGLAAVDGVIHYHVDWAKVAINKEFGWQANTHSEFWILLGFDQFLHYATYIGLVVMFVNQAPVA